MVSGRDPGSRSRRGIGRARLHDHAPVGLWHLGADPDAARSADQGNRSRELLFPAVHPLELFRQGSRARRRLCQGNGGGHAPPAEDGRWRAGRRSRSQAGRAAGRSSDIGNRDRHRVLALAAELARSADHGQPMGECRALGNAHPHVPAHIGIPLAGRPYRARNRSRCDDRDADHPGDVPRFRARPAGDAGDRRRKARERALPRRGRDLFDRSDDAGRQGAAGGHLALSRAEFRARAEHPLPGSRGPVPVRAHHQLGRLDASGRRRDHDARR